MNTSNASARRGGFTMIELMIVIAIITILAAGLTVAVVGIIDRTKRDKTASQVNILQTALNSYKNTFGRNPPVYGGPGWPGGGPQSVVPSCGSESAMVQGSFSGTSNSTINTNSLAHRQARNRAIRIYLETGWRNVREAPFIKGSDQLDLSETEVNGIRLYVDAWKKLSDGSPAILVFNCPGQNHAFDVDEDGRPIKGRYDTSGRAGNETRWVFDIYSFGPDNVDNYNASHAQNGASPTNNKHNDDVVSWGQQVAQ